MYDAVSRHAIPSLSFCEIWTKSSRQKRGTSPSSFAVPITEYVFPEPVCPYANIEQLKPCHAASSIDVPRSPCTSCCEWKVSPSGSCESYT